MCRFTDAKSRQPTGCRLFVYLFTCRPHVYLEPPQPLSPAFFFTSSVAVSTASSAFFVASSSAASLASSAFFFASSTVSAALSAGASTAFSALPAPSLSAAQPLPVAAFPGRAMPPPAPIRLAMPKPARSFFRSFFSMMFLLCLKKSCSMVRADEISLAHTFILSNFLVWRQGRGIFLFGSVSNPTIGLNGVGDGGGYLFRTYADKFLRGKFRKENIPRDRLF